MTLPTSLPLDALTKEQFGQWVHEVLARLYDSPFLQQHPLTNLFSETANSGPQTRSQALRRVLLNGIEAFRPRAGVPAKSLDWRLYRILELRYIEGLNPNEVMAQLSLAKSQFYRDQARILELLVNHLWERVEIPQQAEKHQEVEQSFQSETERLRRAATWEELNLLEQVREVLQITASIAKSRQVELKFDCSTHEPIIRADRVMLRQVLITLIGFILASSEDGVVYLCASQLEDEIQLTLRANLTERPPESLQPGHRLEVCTNLMAALGGKAQFTQTSSEWRAVLTWRKIIDRHLLVVDDNRELVDLYRRFLNGSDWQVVSAQNSSEARVILNNKKPAAILLDIMLPGEDGWEFLEYLKSNPLTRPIPVIICSVVNEPVLAESLGAARSLAKPISQQALIQALNSLP